MGINDRHYNSFPQLSQNFASGSFSSLHAGQDFDFSIAAPHAEQNFASGVSTKLHLYTARLLHEASPLC